MKLTYLEHSVFNALPDPALGEDRADYCRRCLKLPVEGAPAALVFDMARTKWDQAEIDRLIVQIEGGDDAALRKGLIMLLKDRYKV